MGRIWSVFLQDGTLGIFRVRKGRGQDGEGNVLGTLYQCVSGFGYMKIWHWTLEYRA